VGGGGGIAGNVYINGNVGIGALSSASNKLNIQSPVTKLNSYTNISYTYPTSSVLIRNTTNASTLADRSCLINFQKNGLSGSYWDQLAAINMGLNDGQGTSLDFQVAYANGTGQYNYINALTLQSTSLTNSIVGINTATPVTTLDVSGAIRVRSEIQIGADGAFEIERSTTSKTLFIQHFSNPAANVCFINNSPGRTTRVGIDTTTPGYSLDISGGNGAHIQTTDPQLTIRTNRPVYNASKAAIQFFTSESTNPMGRIECLDRSTGNGIFQNDMIFYSGLNVTNVERMRILANGSVGIGTSTPTSTLTVNGQTKSLRNTSSSTLSGSLATAAFNVDTVYSLPATSYVSSLSWSSQTTSGYNQNAFLGSKRESVSSFGSVIIGVGSSDLTINQEFLFHANGNAYCPGTWQTSSDVRLKTDITDADLNICYDNMKKLKLRRWKWRNDEIPELMKIDKHQLGWIAQELEEISPNSVSTTSMYGIDDCKHIETIQIQSFMYGTIQKLMNITEQQQIIIEQLQQRIQVLESK
jgi:hypothetical protein